MSWHNVMLKGHNVEIVYDGFAAVEAAKRQRPDVILLDIGLPGRDGYEVAEILRPDPEFAQTKPVDPDLLDELMRVLPKARN
jgi:CheY-like chemotaxis protein